MSETGRPRGSAEKVRVGGGDKASGSGDVWTVFGGGPATGNGGVGFEADGEVPRKWGAVEGWRARETLSVETIS